MEVLRTTGNLNSTKLCLREKFIPHGGGNLRKNRQKLVNAQETIAYVYIYIYRVSQEERTKLRESVPYVKV